LVSNIKIYLWLLLLSGMLQVLYINDRKKEEEYI